MKKIRLILADDHNILRYGLQLFLSRFNDIEIVGQASSGEECIEKFSELDPDICVIDIEMPRKNGLEVVRAIRKMDADAKILILSMHSDEVTFNEALAVGVDGYLLKDTSKKKILQAIRDIAAGQQVFDDIISETTVQRAQHEGKRDTTDITEREMEILQLVAAGYSSPQIAKQLFISPRTVDTHRNNIMRKLNINNTASLVRYALQNNLVDISPIK